jgi:hypothetical protein
MQNLKVLLPTSLLIAFSCLMISGCPGDGGNQSSLSFRTYTHTASGGVWQNAIIDGYAEDGTYSCDPYNNNTYCFVNFSGASAGTQGYYEKHTDALPAFWHVAARADNTCSQGASTYGQITNGGRLDLTCNSISAYGVSVNPTNCTVYFYNGTQQNSCAPYLTITTQNPILPTSYAMAVSFYSNQGGNNGGSQTTASSSTQITVPAPTSYGENVVTVIDPSTNQTLAAVMYTLHECFIQNNGPYGTTTTCPY